MNFLEQLAVDKNCAGQGIGSGLLKYAFTTCIQAAKLIGGRALIVKAIDDEAANFWQRPGFIQTKDDPLTSYRSMADVLRSSSAKRG